MTAAGIETAAAMPPEGPGVYLGFDENERPWLLRWETAFAFGMQRSPNWIALGFDARDYPAVKVPGETSPTGDPPLQIVRWREI